MCWDACDPRCPGVVQLQVESPRFLSDVSEPLNFPPESLHCFLQLIFLFQDKSAFKGLPSHREKYSQGPWALKNRKCSKHPSVRPLRASSWGGRGLEGRQGSRDAFKGRPIWKGQGTGVFGQPWAQEM